MSVIATKRSHFKCVRSNSELQAVVRASALCRKASCCGSAIITVPSFLLSALRPQIVAFTESSGVVLTHWWVARLRAGFIFLQGVSEHVDRSVFITVGRGLFVFVNHQRHVIQGRSDCGTPPLSDGLASRPIYFPPGPEDCVARTRASPLVNAFFEPLTT